MSQKLNQVKEIHLIYDDSLLLVYPTFPALEKLLSYTSKETVQDYSAPSGFRMVMEKCLVHEVINKDGNRACQTHAGFTKKVIKFLLGLREFKLNIVDQRRKFPAPKLNLMHGFRFNQKEVVTDVLNQDRDGLIGAPTRWGKSFAMLNILRAYPGVKTAVVCPGADLVKQNYTFLKENLPKRKVIQIGGGSTKKTGDEDIAVCSMDSMHKLDADRIQLVLIDEPHALVTENRVESFLPLCNARKIGVGATLEGRFDGRDIYMEGLIGPVLSNTTFQQGVELGAICPIHVIGIPIHIKPYPVKMRAAAYKKLLHLNSDVADAIAYISNEILPRNWQSLTFINNEVQGEFLASQLEGHKLIMAKQCSKSRRNSFTTLMKLNFIKRALATKIYAQGVTFNHVRAIINGEGGGRNISGIQKAGRLAEVREGKKCGVVFDFCFSIDPRIRGQVNPKAYNKNSCAWQKLLKDSKSRWEMYESLGYTLHYSPNLEDAKDYFNKVAI